MVASNRFNSCEILHEGYRSSVGFRGESVEKKMQEKKLNIRHPIAVTHDIPYTLEYVIESARETVSPTYYQDLRTEV